MVPSADPEINAGRELFVRIIAMPADANPSGDIVATGRPHRRRSQSAGAWRRDAGQIDRR